MRRFNELLLLVTCTLPLLFVNGFQALQPSIKNNSLRTDAVIRGLLVPRQFFCQSGFGLCESRFCCPINWNCCRNGSCCQPSFYCVIGSNGVVGCCPNGRICSGPIGEPTTINNPPPPPPRTTNIPPPPPPPPPPTNNPPPPPPPPTNNPLPPPPTTTTHPSSISTSTSTTSTSLLGGPTQSVENQIIDVSVLDVNIKWSENWVLQTSSCDPSIKSKITSTGNSSFTYLSNDIVTSSGYFYYINVANANTEWEVLVNGVSQNTYFSNSSGFTNCTYLKSSNLIHTQLDVSQNITIVVLGLESETLDRSSTSDPWSLEVNMLLIQEQDSSESSGSATSSFTQNTAIPTLTSAAGRAQPYRPLLVPGSILLATVISILRV